MIPSNINIIKLHSGTIIFFKVQKYSQNIFLINHNVKIICWKKKLSSGVLFQECSTEAIVILCWHDIKTLHNITCQKYKEKETNFVQMVGWDMCQNVKMRNPLGWMK